VGSAVSSKIAGLMARETLLGKETGHLSGCKKRGQTQLIAKEWANRTIGLSGQAEPRVDSRTWRRGGDETAQNQQPRVRIACGGVGAIAAKVEGGDWRARR